MQRWYAPKMLFFYFLKWDENSNLIKEAAFSVAIPWMFAFIFLICEFGERVIKQFEMFEEEFDRCNWYTLPSKLQRIYLMFLLDTHKPKTIQSYGRIVCSRETYKKVIIQRIFG